MRIALSLLALLLLPLPAQAQTSYACKGQTPDWELYLSQDSARFVFSGRDLTYEIPQFSTAEGRDWPRAFTLIADYDTAIVVLDEATCGHAPYRAHVLTQRSQTPILLTGCCEASE